MKEHNMYYQKNFCSQEQSLRKAEVVWNKAWGFELQKKHQAFASTNLIHSDVCLEN